MYSQKTPGGPDEQEILSGVMISNANKNGLHPTQNFNRRECGSGVKI